MPDNKIEIEAMNYESAFAALQQVVTQLESQELALEESLQLFQQGQLLVKHCSRLLEQAELKVNTLTAGQDTLESANED